jgi:hypothetical protein
MKARTVADTGQSIDPEKLKYITEHFQSMQGLTWVAFGAFNILVYLRHLFPESWLAGFAYPLALLAIFMLIIRRIQRYYRRRFGWVKPRSRSQNDKEAIVFLLLLLLLLFFIPYLAEKAEPAIGLAQEMIPRTMRQVVSFPVLLWSAFLCMSLRRHSSQEDWHRICFLSSGVIAWAIFALYPLSHPELAQSVIWKTVDNESLFVSVIALGLYEHLTLVRLLPKRIEEDENDGSHNE